MYIDDGATEAEVAEMAAEQRELRRLWLSDPRIVMAQVIRPDGQQHQVPVPVEVIAEQQRAMGAMKAGLFTVPVLLISGLGLAGLLPAWLWLPMVAACCWMAVSGALAWRRGN